MAAAPRTIFDWNKVEIWFQDTIILHGTQDPHTNVWIIPLQLPNPNQPPPRPLPGHLEHQANNATPQANSVYHTSTQANLIQFLHASCGSPVPSTWIKAIDNGHFATWPGLTADLVRTHLPKSTATVKCHLNQQRKNIWSTQPKTKPTPNPQASLDNQPLSETPNERTHHVFATVIDTTGEISTDQTGRFPTTSSRGFKYILILYDYNSNAILASPMRNRSDTERI
jgi:hypothetical protein